MEYQDKQIVCEDCGKEFAHTAEDQRRYAERGFTADPKRCRECRQARKEKAAARQGPGGPMRRQGEGRGGPRSFGDRPRGEGFRSPRRQEGDPFGAGDAFGDRGGGRFGGGGGGHFEGGGGSGGFGRGPRQSYDAVCAACGVKTTLPFEPTPGREVFCRECYRQIRMTREP